MIKNKDDNILCKMAQIQTKKVQKFDFIEHFGRFLGLNQKQQFSTFESIITIM